MSASGGETQPSVEDAPTSHARSPTTEPKEANHASSAGASQPADEAATTQPSTDALTGDLHRTNNEADLCSEEPSVRDEDDSLDDKGGLSIIARLRALGVRGLEDTEEEVAVRAAVLSSFDLKGVAELLREGKAKRIVVMVGAGISVNAGIPDFRTPGTGLYDNLQRFNLPHPQAVFEIDFFRRNPQPFFLLAKELMPGQFRPTLAHHFIRLLADKGLLLRCYTQNIDSLETRAGLPEELLVAAHGNFDTAACIDCGKRHPSSTVHDAIRDSYLPRCGRCDGLVKPGIVFFGENLPDRFFHLYHDDMVQADLLIVMGTSLVVHPFAGLIELVRLDVPRLLINRERAGEGSLPACACGLDRRFNFDASTNYRDALFRGDCDDGVRQLCALLGWKADLDALAASSRAAELPSGTQ